MIPTDGMAIPQMKNEKHLFYPWYCHAIRGDLGLHGSSIAICGTNSLTGDMVMFEFSLGRLRPKPE
jgi:hypothetical protein